MIGVDLQREHSVVAADDKVIAFHTGDGPVLLWRNLYWDGDQFFPVLIKIQQWPLEGRDPQRTEGVFRKRESSVIVYGTKIFSEFKTPETGFIHPDQGVVLSYPDVTLAILVDGFGVVQWLIESLITNVKRLEVNAVVVVYDLTQTEIAEHAE